MSDFVYPRHGIIQELMLKERAWNAKFVRKRLEEEREEREKQQALQTQMSFSAASERERIAEETIMSFCSRPVSTHSGSQASAGMQRCASAGSIGSLRSRRSALSAAGGMTLEPK
mmetsp:Transcript_72993/g.188284  ORF Transcript_72993/g.188284 Transcript_72993/m.188284 type:complete len:115 (+) Transcript_72993:87-431(+)